MSIITKIAKDKNRPHGVCAFTAAGWDNKITFSISDLPYSEKIGSFTYGLGRGVLASKIIDEVVCFRVMFYYSTKPEIRDAIYGKKDELTTRHDLDERRRMLMCNSTVDQKSRNRLARMIIRERLLLGALEVFEDSHEASGWRRQNEEIKQSVDELIKVYKCVKEVNKQQPLAA